jgi:hypothetical protein
MANEQQLTGYPHGPQEVTWNCRFHPTDWWHEVGCPHQAWTVDQLRDQIATMKRGANLAIDSYKTLASQAVDTEREACALLTETHPNQWGGHEPIQKDIAAAIRARGAK